MKQYLKIGLKAEIVKSFSEKEVYQYTKSSIDTNPIHHDIEYAKSTIFKERIVPGLLVASLFGGMLGSELPGEGTIHLGSTLSFKKPVYFNSEVRAVIEIIKIREDKPIITFKTTCYNSNNEIVIDGNAIVKTM
ncbi:MAG: MaoC family dehydratase [Saprospiraceae bacterium]|nr:MaoC family dehydratase [Saprospiraceae bacterium]